MVYEDVYADEEEEEGSEVSTGEASTRRHSLNDIKGATEWPIYEEALSPGSFVISLSVSFALSVFEPFEMSLDLLFWLLLAFSCASIYTLTVGPQ